MTVDRALTRVAFCVLLASSCRSNYSRQVAGSPYPKLERHSPTSVFGQARVTDHTGAPDPVYLIIRSDDAGFSHSVNVALQRLIDSGLPLSVSVMFACPWYQETVEILKREALYRSHPSSREIEKELRARSSEHSRT